MHHITILQWQELHAAKSLITACNPCVLCRRLIKGRDSEESTMGKVTLLKTETLAETLTGTPTETATKSKVRTANHNQNDVHPFCETRRLSPTDAVKTLHSLCVADIYPHRHIAGKREGDRPAFAGNRHLTDVCIQVELRGLV